MRRYITIDGGTTNTRLYLVENGEIKDKRRIALGSGSAESRGRLAPRIKIAIEELLLSSGLKENDIHRILASGMITSEFGLYTVAHSIAPVDIKGVRAGSREVTLPEISSVPFFFISGIKTVGDSPLETNMMRGEETELFGIMEDGEAIYILPGSHNKIIKVDTGGTVIDFMSTITGELIAALMKDTILSVSVDISSDEPSEEGVIDGYLYATAHGMNEALLKPRALKVAGEVENAYIYGFLMGAVLSGEVAPMLKMKERRVIIGGRKEIKEPLAVLLRRFSDKEITVLDEAAVEASAVRGAIRVFEGK